jgi:primary-amine oxidase
MGSNANGLSTAECGGGAADTVMFYDLHNVDLHGHVVTTKKVACVFERWTGDPMWMQGEVCERSGKPCVAKEVRSGVELVVRTIPRIGNYDYIVDVVFRLDGSMHFKVGATGVDAMRAHTPGSGSADGMQHETQMDGFRTAPFHDHFFNFRLDLDIDGLSNRFVVGTLQPYVPDKVKALRPTMWGVHFKTVQAEADAMRDLDNTLRVPEVWTVINPGPDRVQKCCWLYARAQYKCKDANDANRSASETCRMDETPSLGNALHA